MKHRVHVDCWLYMQRDRPTIFQGQVVWPTFRSFIRSDQL